MLSRIYLLLTLLVLLSCTACTGPALHAQINRYPGQVYPPNPADHPIRISEKDFPEAYTVLGEVTTKGYDDRVVDIAGKEELCRLARALGGDGVIRISRKYVEKQEWGAAPETVSGYGIRDQNKVILNGFVIRFKTAQ
jgi:hypothetical protein